MTTPTTLTLAEVFRRNWQSQYPNLGMEHQRTPQTNIVRHINQQLDTHILPIIPSDITTEDDSLTNLNWLQNMNLFSMSSCAAVQRPMPEVSPFHSIHPQNLQLVSATNVSQRFVHPFLETNNLYAEVAQNLEFINVDASTHFFKINSQLRPPFSDINLISMAIYHYNKHKVTFLEICQWIEDTFPFYKRMDPDWKVSIRNNLSLSKCFQKVPRRKNEGEREGFWKFSDDFLKYLVKNGQTGNRLSNMAVKHVQQENKTLKINQPDERPRKRVRSPERNNRTKKSECAFKTPFDEGHIEVGLQDLDSFKDTFSDRGHQDSAMVPKTFNLLFKSTQSNKTALDCSPPPSPPPPLSHPPSHLPPHPIPSKEPSILPDTSTYGMIFPFTSNPCPEQITEEEFLSGRFCTNYYVSSGPDVENTPTVLDSQINFNSSEFNLSDLSITGVGIRPPEWWNQSLSASQISFSRRLSCSLRSLTSVTNIERGSPFGDEDYHIIWHSDQNLEELDILFGLN